MVKNRSIFLLVLALSSVGTATAVPPTEYGKYSSTGEMNPPPGAMDILRWTASLVQTRSDGAAGLVYFRGNSVATKKSYYSNTEPWVSTGSSVYVYNMSGGLFAYNSLGEVALPEGQYNIYVSANYNGSYTYLVPPSQAYMVVAFTKSGSVTLPPANVPVSWTLTDSTTNKVINTFDLPAGESVDMRFTVDQGHNVSLMGAYKKPDGTLDVLHLSTIENGTLPRTSSNVSTTSTPYVAAVSIDVPTYQAGSGTASIGVASAQKITGDTGAATNQAIAGAANFVAGETSEAVASSTKRIVAALAEVKTAVSSGGGGGSTVDFTTTNNAVYGTTAAVTATTTAVSAGNVILGQVAAKIEETKISSASTVTKLTEIATKADLAATKADAGNEKLDQIAVKLEAGNTTTEAIRAILRPADPFDQNAALAVASTAAAGAGAYTGPTVSGSSSAVSFTPEGSPALATVRVGSVDVGLSMDGVGSAFDSALAIFYAARPLLLFALGIWLIRSCGTDLQAYVVGVTGVSAQGDSNGIENIVPGVAQGKTYAGAAVAVGIIVAAVASLVGIASAGASTYGVTVQSIFTAVNLGPIGRGVGFLDRFIPVVAMLQIFVFRAAFPYLLAPAYVAAASALKFAKI